MTMSASPRRHRVLPTVAAGLLILAGIAGSGCSVVPPNGTPIIRAVPPMPATDQAPGSDAGVEPGMPIAVGRDGVIVVFKPGDRIDLDILVDGSIAHVEGEGDRQLVIDREFMVWAHGDRASISFDDGRTWRPADRAITGAFDIDWRRTAPEDGGDVNEIVVGITASPR